MRRAAFDRVGSLWVPGQRRRAWLPIDVPGYSFWFSAKAGVTDSGSGTASALADVRARGTRYTTSQATSGKRPTIATGINSRASLTFASASSQELTNTTDNPIASGVTRYVLIVAKAATDSVGGGGTLFAFRLNTTGGRQWSCQCIRGGDNNTYYFTDAVSNNVVEPTAGAPSIASPFIIEYELTLGATPVVRINGTARTLSGSINATGELGTTGFKIGSGGGFWNGEIGDVFCATGIPSSADKSRLRNFFSVTNGGII